MSKALSFVFIALFVIHSVAQNLINGKAIDTNGNSIAYVSIGIPHSNIGTYSFEDGNFKLGIKISFKTHLFPKVDM